MLKLETMQADHPIGFTAPYPTDWPSPLVFLRHTFNIVVLLWSCSTTTGYAVSGFPLPLTDSKELKADLHSSAFYARLALPQNSTCAGFIKLAELSRNCNNIKSSQMQESSQSCAACPDIRC